MRSILVRAVLAGLLAGLSGLASAHHSFSMFDQTKQVTIVGKVTEVQWTNPHVWIFLDAAPKEGGKADHWGVEFTSKVHLTRRGFSEDMVKVGDAVEFVINPYANGKPGGRFVAVKMANGTYYCDVGQAAMAFCQNDKK
ncbi:MAG TPA: DUF6152 family protein [Candidatus Acidoferrum sp.]|nr:DUF6152 family protein [Candidatus Acidoferrum sp.]